jgi:pimeloyl-ACP methyl ester carboxylesterase
MPFSRNPLDGCEVYFEDDGGEGTPVVILNGLGDPVQASCRWGVAQALAETSRLIFIDHRGHGRSGKPHEVAAYATPTRVAELTSVLDELGIRQAHFIGLSWGARLVFGIGEHAPGRIASLIMGGQTPYAIYSISSAVAV